MSKYYKCITPFTSKAGNSYEEHQIIYHSEYYTKLERDERQNFSERGSDDEDQGLLGPLTPFFPALFG
jgi:hypothetical protein